VGLHPRAMLLKGHSHQILDDVLGSKALNQYFAVSV
jgi:hypothetical protein